MNALAVFAHPDDETMMCGGTLALLFKEGWNVHFVCATRGEGGEAGDPPVCSLEELGHVREGELVCAVGALGGSSLTFLGYVDPRVGPDNVLYPFDADLKLFAEQIAALIQQVQAELVISHGSNGEYGHPAHLLTHQGVSIAVASFAERAPLFYTVQAAYPSHPRPRLANNDDPAHLVLDVSMVQVRKTNAVSCHRTQHTMFIRNTSHDLGREISLAEVVLLEESLHRVNPPVKNGDPVDDILVNSLGKYRITEKMDR
jgi:LmbE family N-acetylglucosaminyl deacetylase